MTTYEKARALIRVLEARGGFDHWWDDIEPAVKRSIIKELARKLEELEAQ